MKRLFLALSFLTAGTVAHATLPPSFHNASLKAYSESVEDFQSQHLGPATFSLYYAENSDLLTAGSYDAQHFGDVVLSTISKAGMSKTHSDMAAKGFAPSQYSVAVSDSAQNLFSILFTKNHPATESHFSLSQSQFTQIYKDATTKSGLRPMEHVEWTELGQNLHTITFAKDGQPYFFVYGVEEPAFDQKIRDLDAQGFELSTFHAGLSARKHLLFSGIWLKKTHQLTVVYVNQTPADYQKRFASLSAQGFQLKKVVGYENGGVLLGGIWVR